VQAIIFVWERNSVVGNNIGIFRVIGLTSLRHDGVLLLSLSSHVSDIRGEEGQFVLLQGRRGHSQSKYLAFGGKKMAEKIVSTVHVIARSHLREEVVWQLPL
jgi:hypothetical protein